MILFLAVLATAPPFDTIFLELGVRVCSSEKKGVYSDREEAEEGGNITAINIKKSRGGNIITDIRLR